MRILLFWHKLNRLCDHTDKIRRHFCFNRFDIRIINSKSSHYSENYTFFNKVCAIRAVPETQSKKCSLLFL